MRKHPGFTLVELLVVVTVLVILGGVVIFGYRHQRNQANTRVNYNRAMQIIAAANSIDPSSSGSTTAIGNNRTIFSSTQVSTSLSSFDSACKVSNPDLGACPLLLALSDEIRTNLTTGTNKPAHNNSQRLHYAACYQGGKPVGIIITYWNLLNRSLVTVTSGKTTGAGITCD